jgi:hypothetical protein
VSLRQLLPRTRSRPGSRAEAGAQAPLVDHCVNPIQLASVRTAVVADCVDLGELSSAGFELGSTSGQTGLKLRPLGF